MVSNRCRLAPATLAFSVAAALAGSASAQVNRYDMIKAAFYTQSADNAPDGQPYALGAYAYLETQLGTDAGACLLTGASSALPLNLVSNDNGNWNGFLGYYNTYSDLETAVPPGSYKFAISGGTLGNMGGGFSLPAPLYPLAVPYLAGDGFTRLQNCDPSQDFTLDFAGIVPNGGTSEVITSFGIEDVCASAIEFSVLNPDSNTVTIPAGTLQPAHQYYCSVSCTGSLVTENAGFGGATSRATFEIVTQFVFTAGYNGCLADITRDSVVDLEDFFAFFNCFDVGDPCANLNGCGGVDLDDFFVFFNAWDQSCP